MNNTPKLQPGDDIENIIKVITKSREHYRLAREMLIRNPQFIDQMSPDQIKEYRALERFFAEWDPIKDN